MVYQTKRCAGGNIRVTWHLFNHFGSALTTCVYEAESVTGFYTTGVTSNALNLSEAEFTSTRGGLCPASTTIS